MRIVFEHNGRQAHGRANTGEVANYLAHLAATGRTVTDVRLEPEDAAEVLSQAAGTELASNPGTAAEQLQTDLRMARVVEDLIDALEAKGVMARADLPKDARDRIERRQAMRAGQT